MARLARFIPAVASVAGLAFVVPSASAHTVVHGCESVSVAR